jgi:hypothetical protein
MTTEAANAVPITAPTPRLLTMDDVHRLIGALALELDQMRRETAALRAQLAARDGAGPVEPHGH